MYRIDVFQSKVYSCSVVREPLRDKRMGFFYVLGVGAGSSEIRIPGTAAATPGGPCQKNHCENFP